MVVSVLLQMVEKMKMPRLKKHGEAAPLAGVLAGVLAGWLVCWLHRLCGSRAGTLRHTPRPPARVTHLNPMPPAIFPPGLQCGSAR